MKKSNHHFKVILLVSLLTIINYVILKLTDQIMADQVIGFKARPSYAIPVIVFFIVVYSAISICKKYGWTRILPHTYIGVAVFFPLIFLTSCWELTNPLSNEMRDAYLSTYCHSHSGTTESICGKALANLVLSRTVSTIPLLFLIPLLFFGLINTKMFSDIAEPKEKLNE